VIELIRSDHGCATPQIQRPSHCKTHPRFY
jgi:hypothetical protein